jgi:molecular chaperone Hsp33
VTDLSLRSMTNDHGFRVIAACTTDSVREVLARQKVTGELARGLSDLVTAAVLLRETMAPDIRVQGLLRGAGGHGQLVGDSFPDGGVRGLAQVKGDRGAFSMGPGAQLKMMRSGGCCRGADAIPGRVRAARQRGARGFDLQRG